MERCTLQARWPVTGTGCVNRYWEDLDGNFTIYGPPTGIGTGISGAKSCWNPLKNQSEKPVKRKGAGQKRKRNWPRKEDWKQKRKPKNCASPVKRKRLKGKPKRKRPQVMKSVLRT